MELEVVNYIKEARLHGLSDSEIKKNLLDAGWEAEKIEESFGHARVQESQQAARPTNSLQQVKQSVQPTSSPVHDSYEPTVLQTMPMSASAQARPKSKKLLWSLVGVIVLLLLAAGGYYAYTYGYINPSGVWKKFTQTKASTIYENNYKISYSDPGTYEDKGFLGMTLKDIKVSLEGGAYINSADPSNPISKSDIQYTFSSGNTSFSTGFKYILLNKVLYLNVGENPLLRTIMTAAGNDKSYEWIKFDFGTINQELGDNSSEERNEIQQILSPDFKEQLQKIWESSTIIKQDKYLGRETVNGVSTLHFKNSVDKDAIKKLVKDYVDAFVEKTKTWSAPLERKDANTFLEVMNQLIDKVEVKELETWIGARDFRLYKVHLVSNGPSFISLMKNANDMDLSSTSSDAKRLADVRQIASALELYYNDNNGYPDANSGSPLNLTPTYMGIWPTAPEPSGTCTPYYNSYWYQPKGTKTISPTSGKPVYSDYELTFCLGNTTGGYSAGIAKLTPAGINPNIPCPTTQEQCISASPSASEEDKIKKKVTDFVSKLNFSAEIRIDADYKNYGQTVDVQAPADYYDILTALSGAREKSRDAKRLSDVMQMASALELYFNDENDYPKELKDTTPNYMGIVPTSPTPNDGTCTPEQNQYVYKYVRSGQYELTFCLGGQTGGYAAGVHKLTPSGIQ